MKLEPERIRPSIQSARVLAKFWKTWYKTTEWAFSMEDHELLEWIHRKGCTVLGILGPDKQLVGTVVSSPLDGTLYVGGNHVEIPLFEIDCLVLHPQIRGRGAAGWLLAWLDFSTSQHGPVAHCWKREPMSGQTRLPKTSAIPMCRIRIAHAERSSFRSTLTAKRVPWEDVKAILHTIPTNEFSVMYVPEKEKEKEKESVRWWRTEIPHNCAILVGIARTHRRKGDKRIWNVVFTCFVRMEEEERMSSPFWYDDDMYCPYIQQAIEASALANACDILTVSNMASRGDPHLERWKGWSIHKAKFYMYNVHALGPVLWAD